MLQKIRDNAHGWWTWVLVPVLILLFAFWGIGNYLGGSMGQNEIAKVNGDSIPVSQFAMLYQSMNNAKNPTQNQQISASIKAQVLQTLIDKMLFQQALRRLGFAVDAGTVDQLIYAIPAFQSGGKFSMQLYQNALQNIGQTTESLKADITTTYLINQFQNGLAGSQFSLPSEINKETAYANLERNVSYVNVNFTQFIPSTPPTEDEIEAYYAAHQAGFMTPAQVKLEYIILSQSSFEKGVDAATAASNYQAALNQLANLTFENAGSLSQAASQLHVPVQTTPFLNTAKPSSVLSNPQVLQAVMSHSVLNQGNNSAVINVSPTQAMVVRVASSQAPQPIPLAQVKASMIAAIAMQKAEQAAALSVQSMVAAVNQGQSLSSLATKYGLKVENVSGVTAQSKNLAPSLLSAVLSMGAGQVQVVPNQQGMMVVEVTAVSPNPKPTLSIPANAISGFWSEIEETSFLSMLQTEASIKANHALLSQ